MGHQWAKLLTFLEEENAVKEADVRPVHENRLGRRAPLIASKQRIATACTKKQSITVA